MDPEEINWLHSKFQGVFPPTSRTSHLPSLVNITSDSYIGYWIVVIAILGAGAIYGLQLSNDRKNFHFPKLVWGPIFFFYVGVMMYAPTGIGQFTMFGVYAYFGYALATVASGLVLAMIATLLWVALFKIVTFAFMHLPALSNTSGLGHRKFVR